MIKIKYVYLIILIIFIIVLLYNVSHANNKHENFDSYGYGTVTPNPDKECPTKNLTNCLKYQNCVYIMTKDFKNKCVAGDVYGPYDKNIRYDKIYHNDPWTRSIVANDNDYKDTTVNVFEDGTEDGTET